MRRIIFLLLAAATVSLSAEDSSVQDPRLSVLSIVISDEDSVVINVNTITSVAMHNYRLNGDNLVSQVTIDTLGNNTIRFYFVHPAQQIEPVSDPKEAVTKVRQQVTRETSSQKDDADVPAVKFPEGTYSHSIEFQVGSPAELKRLYKTALSVWEKKASHNVKFTFKTT